MKIKYLFLLTFFGFRFFAQPDVSAYKGMTKEALRAHFMVNGAWKISYFSKEYQLYIDSAIAVMPNLAYLYQQKAMPYFKQMKYEYAMPILDKAVTLDEKEFIDYRGFMKCIFSKQYADAVSDLERAKNLKGENAFVMDHTLNFYIGLSYLQLNKLDLAREFFGKSLAQLRGANAADWVHPLDLFYAGITEMELGKNETAIQFFDLSLKNYPHFADAEYYKSMCLRHLGKTAEAESVLKLCIADLNSGYTMNEDNGIYERYPYQLEKYWLKSK